MAAVISVYLLIRRTVATQIELGVQKGRSDRLDDELAALKQFYKAKLSGEEELRALRHDMKGHLSTLSDLLTNGKTVEAVQYLERLVELEQSRQTGTFCGNPYINMVLSIFVPRFKENKIPFHCRIGVEAQELPSVEVCLILNNALENALEASLQRPEPDRAVKVQIAIRKNRLLFRVSNRFDGTLGERGGLPATTKDGKGHGYGLANIRSTAERLGGAMKYRVEEGYFVLDVYFQLQENTEERI